MFPLSYDITAGNRLAMRNAGCTLLDLIQKRRYRNALLSSKYGIISEKGGRPMRAKDNPAIPGIGSGPYGAEPGFTNEDCVPEYGPGKEGPGSAIPANLGRMLYEDPAAMQRFAVMTKEEQYQIVARAAGGMDRKDLREALYKERSDKI
jgi:hypothetical protein